MASPTRTARLARAGTLALLGLASPAAAGEDPAAPAAPAALTVAVPPGAGPTAGFDRDLFGAVARDMGATVSIVEVAPAEALAGLDARRWDVAAGPFAPAEIRGRRPLPPVATRGDALLKRRGDGALMTAADVAGKRVGVPDAAVAAALRALAAASKARVAWRQSFRPGDGEADLAAGRVAALAGPIEVLAAAALARPGAVEVVGPPFGAPLRLAPAMRPGADGAALAEAVAAALARMRADGRLAALQRRWFGLAFDPPDAAPGAPSRAPPRPAGP